MTQQTYIVVNGAGLNVRSKPDTKTGKVIRKLTMGEGFVAYDVFIVRNETWARLSKGDSVYQEYCMIEMTGRPAFARSQYLSAPQPSSGDDWRNAIDGWARSRGFVGPQP